MADRRQHRGPHPQDEQLFAPEFLPALRSATADLSLLLSRSYAVPSSLKLVGDRYRLTERQRTAVMRCACSDQSLLIRDRSRLAPEDLAGRDIAIDGFNLLTTVEVAMGQGVLIRGRDRCLRDMASMHGTYRKVQETAPALVAIGECLTELVVGQVTWLLDRPVSNSGRLVTFIRDVAEQNGWNWTAQLDNNPDAELIQRTQSVVVSADSYIIENCKQWTDMASIVVSRLPTADVLDF